MACDVGTRLGPYRLTAECGNGAYGRVFVAENILTGRRVALKVISGSGRQLERELQGLIRYRSCNHPNLLTVHHIDRLDDGSIYYTMDLADNLADSPDEYLPDTLAHRLERSGPLPTECVQKLAGELLDGLEALHRLGLVHRDVKPDNILWIGGRAVLSDIGLVTEADAVSFAGTPGFLSPELSTGKRNAMPRDDFYALGKALYCALTGEAVGNYPSLSKKLLSGSPRQLIGAIFKACGTPGFESAAEFRMALLSTRPTDRISRYKICSGISLLLLLGFGTFFFMHGKFTLQSLKNTIFKEKTLLPPPGWVDMNASGKLSIPDITENWPWAWSDLCTFDIPAFFQERQYFPIETLYNYSYLSPQKRDRWLLTGADWVKLVTESCFQVSTDGTFSIASDNNLSKRYQNLPEVLKCYERYYQPRCSWRVRDFFAHAFGYYIGYRELHPASEEELHKKFLHYPSYQMAYLEASIQFTLAEMLLEEASNIAPLVERFRWLCKRRKELIDYYQANNGI